MAPTRPSFVPCPACHRHVKSVDAACPFCAAELRASAPAPVPDTRGWKRAAVFTFGAALAVGGCSATTTSIDAAPQDTAATQDAPAADQGAADVASDTAGDAPYDNGGSVPPYGLPPPTDAGVADSGPPDDGSVKADYGAPPPRDAATDR